MADHRPQERPLAPRAGAADYEPPRIETLGTVEELTMGSTSTGTDSGFVGTSDRRLKEHVACTERRDVLARLARL